MTDSNQEEVKEFVDRVEIDPAPDGDETIDSTDTEDENETPSESSEDEKQPDPVESADDTEDAEDTEEEPELKKDQVVGRNGQPDTEQKPKPVAGETPREHALRLETERLKGLLRKEKGQELFNKTHPAAKPLDENRSKLLEKYDQAQLGELREILNVMADDMGFVKKDEFTAQSYNEQAQDQLDVFLESHPQYLPENDKDGVLWNRFKDEFGMYKQPENPKAFKKLYSRIHENIFGIQSTSNLNKIQAQKQKIKVASHTGSSAARTIKTGKAPTQGLRTDMLKGFSEDEIKEFSAE